MIVPKPILIATVLLTLPFTDGNAQEDHDDILEQLTEARQSRDRVDQRAQLLDRRIKLLVGMQRAIESLGQYVEKIETAEDRNDESRADQLREEAEAAEMSLEFRGLLVEITYRREELLDQAGRIPREEKGLIELAEKIRAQLTKVEALVGPLLKSVVDGEDVDPSQFEEEIELLHEEIDLNFERLSLRIDLLEAEENDEQEWVEELKEELRALGDFGTVDLTDRKPLPEVVPPVVIGREQIAKVAGLDFNRTIAPLLQRSCGDCHSADSASGDLDLAALAQQQPLVINREAWLNVIQQLRIRSMPPADGEPIPEEDRVRLTAWLTHAIEDFDYESIRQPGYEPARRLTHEEYNNTVRDLIGVSLRPADRFPPDMSATSGFDNSANSLFLQPALLERYLGAAERIVGKAYPDDRRHSKDGWNRLLVDKIPSDQWNAETVIRRLLMRAWRREPEPEAVVGLAEHFESQIRSGASRQAAIRDVIQVVLVSPGFLIRTEQDGPPGGQPYRVTDWELASRLSYFLWGSMPDDRLFQLAKEGRLSEPSVLNEEVHRMLVDRNSHYLGQQFAAQWLGFDGMDRLPRSPIDNPWQTDSLILSMKHESASLFNHMVQANLPLDRLVDADFTFVNEELAQHYGMDGVKGDQFQKISLTNSPRRGVLGHGSVLAVTSFPGRTSPVVRGNWILSELLGTPPPPPPPNVSQFDEEVAENRRITPREKLELHRSSPNCSTCHSQIDPLGFALEEFEWYGRHQPTRRGKPVDTTSKLPEGAEFQGLVGLSRVLVEERSNDLVTQATRKMLAFALGRQLEYYDEATVRGLVKDVQADGRRVQALILGIVQSDAFQMKRKTTDVR